MNKKIILTLTSLSSLFLLSQNITLVHAKDSSHTVAITNSTDIKTDKLDSNHAEIDTKTQDALVKPAKTDTEKSENKNNSDDQSNNTKHEQKSKKDNHEKDNQPELKNLANDNAIAIDDSSAHYQKGIPKYFKVTFYDPRVLGAVTMPGGLYAGVAADLNVFPKGTHLRITLPDGRVLKRVVNDTGTFAYTNHYQLDIAMPNSQIPSYGTGSAKVELLD